MGRYQQSNECPCGKSNKDGKYQPAEYGGVGICRSCDKYFNYEEREIIKNNRGQWRTEEGGIASLSPAEHIPQKMNNSASQPIIGYAPQDVYLASMDIELYRYNNFALYLIELTGNPELVYSHLQLLNVGTIKNSYGYYCTIFWYLDINQNILNGKVFTYNLHTGKRDKVLQPFSYCKSTDGIKYSFGLYNICNKPKQSYKNIYIVESEKTAVLGSLTSPEHLWLATGGKTFNKNLLNQLEFNNIIAIPDVGAESLWSNIFNNLQIIKEQPEGTDIGDLIINKLNSLQKPFSQDTPAGWYYKTTPTKSCIEAPLCKPSDIIKTSSPNLLMDCSISNTYHRYEASSGPFGFVYGNDIRPFLELLDELSSN